MGDQQCPGCQHWFLSRELYAHMKKCPDVKGVIQKQLPW